MIAVRLTSQSPFKVVTQNHLPILLKDETTNLTQSQIAVALHGLSELQCRRFKLRLLRWGKTIPKRRKRFQSSVFFLLPSRVALLLNIP